MTMAKAGDNIETQNANWRFSGETVKNFDQHVEKSVPLYNEGHTLICDISDFFLSDNSIVYEIGCSTGALISKIAKHNSSKKVDYFAIDIEKDMITAAKKMATVEKINNVEFIHNDFNELNVDDESVNFVVCYYTMQFISPALRQKTFDKIYRMLKWGGGFVIFEKTRAPDARFQDIMSLLYTEYKLKKGYTSDEIISKSRSLKGVLEPFSLDGNIGLMNRAGFKDICSIQKYICFEGFLAIK